jgi:hypothetical protein
MMVDKMVKPLYEREERSAPGPFYVVKNQCITCSLPTNTAPENIQYQRTACADCAEGKISHCAVIRQPETSEELNHMIEVVQSSCIAAYRYCGTDSEILRRLVSAGCRDQCDALVRKKWWHFLRPVMRHPI